MDVPPTPGELLQSLTGSPRSDGSPAASPVSALSLQWDRLSREVVAVVPSCTAVSIAFSRLGVDVVITAPVATPGPRPPAVPVLSSLALSLPAVGSDCVLVLQASTPGAFGPLAEGVALLLGSGHRPPELDAHLTPVAVPNGPTLAEALADLRLLDRALGVLIGRGWPPEAAEAELHRRSAVAGLPVAAVAERMLAEPSASAACGTD